MNLLELTIQYIIVILFLMFLFWAKKNQQKIPRKRQNKLKKWVFRYSIFLGNPIRTILFPFLVIFLLNGIYPFLGESQIDLTTAIIIFPLMVVIQPLMEEMIFRGMFFGSFMTFAKNKKRSHPTYISILLSGLLIQSVLFMLFHMRINIPNFINGSSYALFFYTSNKRNQKNLLPAWIAHSTNNLIIWLAQLGLFQIGWLWMIF